MKLNRSYLYTAKYSLFTKLVKPLVGLPLVVSFLFAASGSSSAQTGQTYQQLLAAHPGWVQVPGQLIRPDCVHEVPNGSRVEVAEDGRPTGDVKLNGQLIAHYDPCSEAPISTRHLTTSGNTPGHNPGPINGWMVASQENLSWLGSTDNIDWVYGQWYVPYNPSVNGGLIYIFNGIEPAVQDRILQPVLQYGYSPAGGGNYWAIASWIVGAGGTFHSPLQGVNPGDLLRGATTENGVSWNYAYYQVSAHDFNNGADSTFEVGTPSYLHWTWAYEAVLEVYNVNSCSQLPSSDNAYFYNNYVDHGYPNYYSVSPAFWGAVYNSVCYDSVYVSNTYDYAYLNWFTW